MKTLLHVYSVRLCHCASSMNQREGSSHACSEADMGLLALFRRSPPSAHVAKERLRIIVQQERNARGGGPDYLPLLRRELLEVIRKYVNVDPAAVQINVEREDGQEVLEFSVALPEKAR
jgi:cell division topological specificity factor